MVSILAGCLETPGPPVSTLHSVLMAQPRLDSDIHQVESVVGERHLVQASHSRLRASVAGTQMSWQSRWGHILTVVG